ncbi:MAG: hypothetical protein H6696_03770 [Deferribacteres bacterium]|nr:hypothetical protein [candidate division KSB1 bacterium]MCB9501030.1 hypothetical protein [Deferribacteres bacterium]
MQRYKILCRNFASLLVLAIFIACTGNHENKNSDSSPPDDLTIVFGEGGGITGLWQGYTIESDGSVLTWQGRVAEANPTAAGKISEEALSRLWQSINENKIFTQSGTEPGNITRFLRITSKKQKKQLNWAQSVNDKTSELNQFYDLCREIVSQE